MEYVIIQALGQCIERLPADCNKEWITRLFQNSINGASNSVTDDELIYNATLVENVMATLLAIDIRVIVKVRMVYKVIVVLWEVNEWDQGLLNSYIVEKIPGFLDSQANSSQGLAERSGLNGIDINKEMPNGLTDSRVQYHQSSNIPAPEKAPTVEIEMYECEHAAAGEHA